VNRDGVVNSTDAADWDNLYTEASSNAAIPVDFDFDGAAFDPADNDAFYAAYSEASGWSNGSGGGSLGGKLSRIGNRKGYAGYEFDVSVEAYHVRHRVYLPELGRWTKRDPLGYVDGVSVYEYVNSQVMRAIDPTGRSMMVGPVDDDPCKLEKALLDVALLEEAIALAALAGCIISPNSCPVLYAEYVVSVAKRGLAQAAVDACGGTLPPIPKPKVRPSPAPIDAPVVIPVITPGPVGGDTDCPLDSTNRSGPGGNTSLFCAAQRVANGENCDGCCNHLPTEQAGPCKSACTSAANIIDTQCRSRIVVP